MDDTNGADVCSPPAAWLPSAGEKQRFLGLFKELFNLGVVGFYWRTFEPKEGAPLYRWVDKNIRWCQDNRIKVRGHPLVWNFSEPEWLNRYPDAKKRAITEKRVRELLGRYESSVAIWDVVNEPFHIDRRPGNMSFLRPIGNCPRQFSPYYWARKTNSKAALCVNDYNHMVETGLYQEYASLIISRSM